LILTIRNYDEDGLRKYRDANEARADLDEVDEAINRISFETTLPLRKTALQFVQGVLEKHGFETMAIVSIEDASR